MKLRVVGCSHHQTSVEARERLAFNAEQSRAALRALRTQYPDVEAVLLSTCNRVEFYFAASETARCPDAVQVAAFLGEFHGLIPQHILPELLAEDGEGALHHLFLVAASLDSMVVGEAQILSQVKQAYDLANTCDSTGPLLHSVFQAAMRVARRVARETAINQKRVSIPSIAVSEFAKQLFERFDDKSVLILGAGEMGEETLRYLMNEGVQRILIANRHHERAAELAERLAGKTISWEDRCAQLAAVDLVIGTTGAPEPVVSFEQFRPIAHRRADRPLFMLDLAVPRDFEPAIGDLPGVYLYSLDDLQRTCDANRREREREWPKATSIVEDETSRFVADLNHRATAPTIQRLKAQADELKTEELTRLLNRLGTLDPHAREEISRSFDRLVNKILHPPMESLRDEATRGTPHGLLDALKRLFQIQD